MDKNCKFQGQFKKELQGIFRGYKNITSKMENQLKRMGFVLVRNHTHCVLEYVINGKKCVFVIAKTPSDGRAGLNVASKICMTLTKNSQIF